MKKDLILDMLMLIVGIFIIYLMVYFLPRLLILPVK